MRQNDANRTEIGTARLSGGIENEIGASVHLAEVVMRPGTVADDLGAVQREEDVRTQRREQLLASLGGNHSIVARDERHSKWNRALA